VRRGVSLALATALVLSGAAVWRLGVHLDVKRYSGDVAEEMMYFPSGRMTEVASMGFNSLAATLLWLRGIQYYGAHKRSDQYYLLAEHIFQTITDLDPHFMNAYRFGAFVISQDMGQPAGGVELLKKGMRYNYDSWQLFFDLGFLYFVDVGDEKKAARYFSLASRFPDAPEIAKRFSAFAHKRAGNYAVSRKLWEEIYQSTSNQAMKENALFSLKMVDLDESLHNLNRAAAEFKERRGRAARSLDEIAEAGLVRFMPDHDPFGGRYFLDSRTGLVHSSTRVEKEAGRLVGNLQQKIDYYFGIKGSYPKSIEDLRAEDLISEIPSVEGAVIVYDPARGLVSYTLTDGSPVK
jgi:tetratricopeptide (TPR) repeat protein